jgi:hypothetical protein
MTPKRRYINVKTLKVITKVVFQLWVDAILKKKIRKTAAEGRMPSTYKKVRRSNNQKNKRSSLPREIGIFCDLFLLGVKDNLTEILSKKDFNLGLKAVIS